MRYVYCHPLFDERKCAHRFSYQLKTAFEASGLNLERFDYRGTGEAPGEFSQVSLDSLRQDVAQHVRRDEVCLIGLRFGASLAFDYCARSAGRVRTLVLVEPVIDGAEYVGFLRRKQHIKNVMTAESSDTSDEEGCENIEGYKTSSKFVEQMMHFDLPDVASRCAPLPCIFIAHVSRRSKISPQIVRLAEVLKRSGSKVSVENARLPVFWQRIPSADYGMLTSEILRWCGG
jgi:pimeloyl-ACP methyl ester carboxylesterase